MHQTRVSSIIGFLLTVRLKHTKKSEEDLAKVLHLKPHLLANRLAGKVRFKMWELQNVLPFFGITYTQYLKELNLVTRAFFEEGICVSDTVTVSQDILAKARGSKMAKAKVEKLYLEMLSK